MPMRRCCERDPGHSNCASEPSGCPEWSFRLSWEGAQLEGGHMASCSP